MNVNRKQILKGILEDIADISDKEYQRRIWIRVEGPECDDFTEIVCRFFSRVECLLEGLKEDKLSNSQLNILKTFICDFEKFADEHDFPQQFIDTPEWTHITELAKEVLRAFNYEPDEHANK